MQVREAYSRWWHNQQNNYQFLGKLSLTKSTLMQTSVSYNDVIMTS